MEIRSWSLEAKTKQRREELSILWLKQAKNCLDVSSIPLKDKLLVSRGSNGNDPADNFLFKELKIWSNKVSSSVSEDILVLYSLL